VASPGPSCLRRAWSGARRHRHQLAWVGLLSGLAAATNLVVIPLYFGIQLLPGSALAVLGVLWFGAWGIVIGGIASLVTIHLWGHPWAIIIFSLEIAWLYLYVATTEYINQRGKHSRAINHTLARRKDDGGIILADIVFWLLVGIPLVVVFYGFILKIDSASVMAVALKQAVNGVINTATSFVIYLLIRSRLPASGKAPGLSILGVSFSAILMAITIPSLALTKVVSHQLENAAEAGQYTKMQLIGNAALALPRANLDAMATSLTGAHSSIAFARWDRGKLVYSSTPALFDRLDRDFRSGKGDDIQHKDLGILVNRREHALLKTWLNGFWIHEQTRSLAGVQQRVIVVEAARDLVVELQRQSARLIAMLASVVLIGALISELLGRLIAAQFTMVLHPRRHRLRPGRDNLPGRSEAPGTLPLLSETLISELNSMVRLINNRITNNNRLTQALRRSNQQLAISKRQLEKLSTTDPLTGCYNRRELQRRLDEEIQRSGRSGTALSCLCIDIDHFKEVNDTYGHPSGDEVLRRVAGSLAGRIRSTDCLCRSGGEEFTMLLICCSAPAAIAMAEQLRLAIAAIEIPIEAGMVSVTISLGVTGYRPGSDDAQSLLSRADRALYQAKTRGRNRVESL